MLEETNFNFKEYVKKWANKFNETMVNFRSRSYFENNITLEGVEVLSNLNGTLFEEIDGKELSMTIDYMEESANSLFYNNYKREAAIFVFSHGSFMSDDKLKTVIYLNLDTYEVSALEKGEFVEKTPSQVSRLMGKLEVSKVFIDSNRIYSELSITRFIKSFIGMYARLNFRLSGSPIEYFQRISKDNISPAILKADINLIIRSIKNQDKISKSVEGFDIENIYFDLDEYDRKFIYRTESKRSRMRSKIISNQGKVLFAIGEVNSMYREKLPIFFIVFDEKRKRKELLATSSGLLLEKDFSGSNYMMDQDVIMSDVLFTETEYQYTQDIINMLYKRKELGRRERHYDFGLGFAIFTLLDNPIYDQLFRVGYERLVLTALTRRQDTQARGQDNDDYLENYIGVVNYDSKKLTGKLGVSPSQLAFFKSVENQNLHSIRQYKFILTDSITEPISQYSEKEFKLIEEVLDRAYETNGDILYASKILRLSHNISGYEGMCGAKRYMEEVRYYNNMLEHYSSYLSLYEQTYELLDFRYDWTISSFDDLENRIRDLTIYLEELSDQLTREEFEARSNKLKKYEVFDEESGFMIIAPNKQSDFVNEGRALKHCIAGYANSYKNGDTKILFVRKTNDPMTPLYTLEVKGKNTINQFYGRSNTRPSAEALDFVEKFLKTI